MDRPVRIANCSGFYGDRMSALAEMVEGGPVDVITGDYLAEVTMLVLAKNRLKKPGGGYASTFLRQLEPVVATVAERGIKIVVNAGGLDPAGLADATRALLAEAGVDLPVAHVEGDDLAPRIPALLADGHELSHLDTGEPFTGWGRDPLTANAYLGGFGVQAALAAGADIVVTGRVADASLITGAAAWWWRWTPADLDALAGAVVAGHVIECGAQASGGNFSGFRQIADLSHPGFPLAEVDRDGTSVITKHEGTGGLVSVGTVTAQLLYEIAEPAYLNPDVVAHFDTIELSADGPDRVLISGTKGSPPPDTLKVALNYLGGHRNTMTLVLTGLDIEAKAAWARELLGELLGGWDTFDDADIRLLRFDTPDAPTNEQATAHLRITVKDGDPAKVGRRFSDATMALALGGYAGFHTTTPPSSESAYGVYWPALVPADVVEHVVHLPDGTTTTIPHSPSSANRATFAPETPAEVARIAGETVRVPLGTVAGARSGDKGGNANIGLWARDDAAYAWLAAEMTPDRVRELLPEAADLEVRVFALPNLRAVNVVIVGLLGEGVAASTRPDPQAKGLGEYLRSRLVDLPAELVR